MRYLYPVEVPRALYILRSRGRHRSEGPGEGGLGPGQVPHNSLVVAVHPERVHRSTLQVPHLHLEGVVRPEVAELSAESLVPQGLRAAHGVRRLWCNEVEHDGGVVPPGDVEAHLVRLRFCFFLRNL